MFCLFSTTFAQKSAQACTLQLCKLFSRVVTYEIKCVLPLAHRWKCAPISVLHHLTSRPRWVKCSAENGTCQFKLRLPEWLEKQFSEGRGGKQIPTAEQLMM